MLLCLYSEHSYFRMTLELLECALMDVSFKDGYVKYEVFFEVTQHPHFLKAVLYVCTSLLVK
jgi:hypothetical protein